MSDGTGYDCCVDSLPASSLVTSEHIRALMYPKGVALVGATEREGSVGKTILSNLIEGSRSGSSGSRKGEAGNFEIYPVNPMRESVMGYTCFANVCHIVGKAEGYDPRAGNGKIAEKAEERWPELVVVVTPANRCAGVIKDCGESGRVKAVIVIAAGFKEVGPEGLKMEEELVRLCCEWNMALVGPNCLGVQSPAHGLNATFAACAANAGSVAFISQSGAMCTAVLDWSLNVGLGFSAFISLGSMAHVDWSSLIDFFGNDANTASIILYMEGIGHAGYFLAAARRVTPKKPVIIVKAGRSEAAAAAAVSHTGSLTGSHSNFLAAMKRAGCAVVDTIDDLQHAALLTSKQPPPINEDVYIITNAGGPGVLCTDAADEAGLRIPDLPSGLVLELSKFLPHAWSHSNPVDILGDATADAYSKTVSVCLDVLPKGTSIIVVLSPQSVTDPTATARSVLDVLKNSRDQHGPVVCSWMGGPAVHDGMQLFVEAGYPCFSQPDVAARALGLWVRQKATAALSCSSPQPPMDLLKQATPPMREAFVKLYLAARKRGETILSEHDAKAAMKAFGIPVAGSEICTTADQAVRASATLGYPVVMKIHGGKFTHKSDIGCVKLNLRDAKAVQAAFDEIKSNYNTHDPDGFEAVSLQPMIDNSGVELLVGCVDDLQFGPMLVFGAGGTYVEIFQDTQTTLPPVTPQEAEILLVNGTRIAKALDAHGSRFKGCPRDQLYTLISKFSIMCTSLWEYVKEWEINPVMANAGQVIALDARAVIREEPAKDFVCPALLCPTIN